MSAHATATAAAAAAEIRQRRALVWWQALAAASAVAAALAAVGLTLEARFLQHPSWLAIQKADLILGPVFVGLYWHRCRPQSRFGPLLIAYGFLHVPYVLQSSSASLPFTIGVAWEGVIYTATVVLILAFPSGRLAGLPERTIAVVATVVAWPLFVAYLLLSPQIFGDGSISGCRGACPANAFLVSAQPRIVLPLVRAQEIAIVAVAAAMAVLIVWRLATGSPPRRRALAVGAPVALVFLAGQMTYQSLQLFGLSPGRLDEIVRWTFAAARSALWYGFLLALVVAQLYAARVLRRMVQESLRRPSIRELEEMLREPLGDPGLQLAFAHPGPTFSPGRGRALTVVDSVNRSAALIVHDEQLLDDPELLQAAGATALLAHENAELEAAWSESLYELRSSRARIAAASDAERRRIERDLHDGAQQSLVAMRVHVSLAQALAEAESPLAYQLNALALTIDVTIDELRELAHGIYPPQLADEGVVRALERIARRGPGAVEVRGEGVGRYALELESAIYYSAREALQNAIKHAGATSISIRLHDDGAALAFEVRDDGTGFDPAEGDGGAGTGLHNMRDRLGAFGGHVEVTSAPGNGTVVAGTLPF